MSTTEPQGTTRRDVLKASAAAAFTTMIFPKMMRGANDKLAVGFIGTGTMGQGNVQYALQTDKVQAVSICDVYQPNLEKAIGVAKKRAKVVKAQTEVQSIETAWKTYFNEYGQWPVVNSGAAAVTYLIVGGVNADSTSSQGLLTGIDTAALLLGIATAPGVPIGNYNSGANNPKLIQFTNLKKDPATGQLLDPWGNPYKFLFDTGYILPVIGI